MATKESLASFPSWRYHKTEKARIVTGPEQDEALGRGWSDVPFDGNEPGAAGQPTRDEVKALAQEADRLSEQAHALAGEPEPSFGQDPLAAAQAGAEGQAAAARRDAADEGEKKAKAAKATGKKK